MSDEIHDHSRVDAFMAARRRSMMMHAMWKPAVAGAAGAALMIAAVYVTLPKFSTREVVVDHVVPTDVAVDHIVPRDVQVDRVIPHDVIIDIPRFAATPAEKRFLESPAFTAAPIHGRIVPSRGERSLSFDDGNDYTPTLPGMAADAARFVGLWGYCSPITGTDRFHCFALQRDGTVVSIPQKPLGRPT